MTDFMETEQTDSSLLSGTFLKCKNLDLLNRYWQSMRQGNDIPRRTDIDPRGIQPLLENAMIAEKIATGLARLRIAGQHLSDLMGMEVRGMPLSAFIVPDSRDRLADLLTELFDRPSIITLKLASTPCSGGQRLYGKLVLLPLRSDLGDVSRALGCLITQGSIGRAPRRFEIVSSFVDPVNVQPPHTNPTENRPGFAETAEDFVHNRPAHPSERPYLRLVKS